MFEDGARGSSTTSNIFEVGIRASNYTPALFEAVGGVWFGPLEDGAGALTTLPELNLPLLSVTPHLIKGMMYPKHTQLVWIPL